MTAAALELLVEPFRENDPGPHVRAVVDVVTRAGLDIDMGPFATTVAGDLAVIADTVGEMLRAGFAAGATAIAMRVRIDDAEPDRR
jgi:uncharacterized protein YqgV (UPF0045/DUF77 family)